MQMVGRLWRLWSCDSTITSMIKLSCPQAFFKALFQTKEITTAIEGRYHEQSMGSQRKNSQTTLHFNSMSDQDRISPQNVHAISSRPVMIIK